MANEEKKEQPPFHQQYHQPEPTHPPINGNGNGEVANGFLRIIMLLSSSIILGIAMLSGAYIAVHVISLHTEKILANLWPILIVVGLAYVIGWAVALAGIRIFSNLVLPYLMNIYAWATLTGILILYAVILSRLYGQEYYLANFLKYVTVMGAAFAALLGFHLLIENHSLLPFSGPLLLFNVGHLSLIVYHYIFAPTVKYEYLTGDLLFFFGMTAISIFMMIRVGVLTGVRNFIDRIFEKNGNGNGNGI